MGHIDRRTMCIHEDGLRDRVEASIPFADPRFGELRRMLASVQRAGKESPRARMLGEWALLGFLLTTGRIAIGGEAGADLLAGARADLEGQRAAAAHVAAALDGVDWG